MARKCRFLVILALVACSAAPETVPQPTVTQNTPTPQATDAWSALFQKMPFPYTTPLPPQSPTVLDGLYVKLNPQSGTPVPCRRCPDYLPQGGIWKLSLDKGTFRIFFETTGWYSLGSFAVSGDHISFFNDPHCYDVIGVYKWKLQDGQLRLELIEDACQLDRRGRSFSSQPWNSCQAPPTGSETWAEPPGCGGKE